MARQSQQTQSQTQKVIINMQGVTQQKKKHKKRSQSTAPPAMPPPPPPKLPPYTVFPSVQMIQNPNPNAPIPDYIQSGYNNWQQSMENMQTGIMNQFNDLKTYLNAVGNTDPNTTAQVQQMLDMLQQQMTGVPSDNGDTSGLLDDSDQTLSGMTTPVASEQEYPTPRQLDFQQFNTYTMTPAIRDMDAQTGTPASANNMLPTTPRFHHGTVTTMTTPGSSESPTLPLPPSPFDNQGQETQAQVDAAAAGPSYRVMEPTEELQNLYNLRDPKDDEFLEQDLEDMEQPDLLNLYQALDPVGFDRRVTKKETLIVKILGLQNARRRATPPAQRRGLKLDDDE